MPGPAVHERQKANGWIRSRSNDFGTLQLPAKKPAYARRFFTKFALRMLQGSCRSFSCSNRRRPCMRLEKNVKKVLQEKGSSEVYSIGPDETMYDALCMMARQNVGALVVTDDGRT